jgi:hypothetical protein
MQPVSHSGERSGDTNGTAKGAQPRVPLNANDLLSRNFLAHGTFGLAFTCHDQEFHMVALAIVIVTFALVVVGAVGLIAIGIAENPGGGG